MATGEPIVSGAWCLKSTEKKDPMDDDCPVILADFKPVALPGAQSTMVSGVRSWQMVGSAPVEEVRTNVTKEDQTNINGPKATPTDVALADVKAGLLALLEPHHHPPRRPTSPRMLRRMTVTASTSLTRSVKLVVWVDTRHTRACCTRQPLQT